jgi:hypothetical protein
VLTVTLKVLPPWHVYGNPVGLEDLVQAETTVALFMDGKKVPISTEFPKGKLLKDPANMEYRVYEGEIVIKCSVEKPGEGEGEVRVKLQACQGGDSGQCLSPATLTIPVKK